MCSQEFRLPDRNGHLNVMGRPTVGSARKAAMEKGPRQSLLRWTIRMPEGFAVYAIGTNLRVMPKMPAAATGKERRI